MAKQHAKSNDKPSHAPLQHTERSARKAEMKEEIQTWEDEGGAELTGPQLKDPTDGYDERAGAQKTERESARSVGEPARNIDGNRIGENGDEPRGRSGGSRAGAKNKAGSRGDR